MIDPVSIPESHSLRRPATIATPARVAVALHLGARGGDHLDLFVGPVGEGDSDVRVARCWRLPIEAWRAEGLANGRFAATEIELHRAAYLSIVEPRELSGGRGRVEPLARGAAEVTVGMPLIVRWGAIRIELGQTEVMIAGGAA